MKILPTRFFGPLLAKNLVGMVLLRWVTIVCENVLTVSQSCLFKMGTTTCKPLQPLVFKKAGKCNCDKKTRIN